MRGSLSIDSSRRMADGRIFSLNHQLDIGLILVEAKTRWLRPSEICEILRNHQKFYLTSVPPYKPPSGSLYLFDRKALRYFRKDGHCWRKKKDGKTVREAHEKLKSSSIDVLHCYYAHGEGNENFQRRSYWMLEGHLEHIVLVHYRDVNEGRNPSTSNLAHPDAGRVNHLGGTQSSSTQSLSSEFEEADSGDDYLGSTNTAGSRPVNPFNLCKERCQNITRSEDQLKTFDALQLTGFSGGISFIGDSTLSAEPETAQKCGDLQKQMISLGQPNSINNTLMTMTNSLSGSNKVTDGTSEILPKIPLQSSLENGQVKETSALKYNGPVYPKCTIDSDCNIYHSSHKHHIHAAPQVEYDKYAQVYSTSSYQSLDFLKEDSCPEMNAPKDNMDNGEHGELKKLDSFGRWMDKEIGRDCDSSLMASDSGSYWNALETQNDDKEVTSLSMQLAMDSLGPSISQEQLFSIIDFSPDWAYSKHETKVLISGTFLAGIDPGSVQWCCMFGEEEVSAEILTANVLRCQAPAHAPGRVPFYVTCSNRLACSEIREFEFREKFSGNKLFCRVRELRDEIHLQVCFAKLLSTTMVAYSLGHCHKCDLINQLFLHSKKVDIEWNNIEEQSKAFQGLDCNIRDALIQNLLRGKLHEWLLGKVHEEGKGPNMLDEDGLGVIHYAAALGYEWAIGPIVHGGVSPNFRDARGRTGLHWAAYYAREEAVVTLVRLGAAPGALQDPTSMAPEGQTAADLASNRGHKGIAGYLAEADLTSHLSAMIVEESIMDSVAVNLAAERAVEKVQVYSIVPLDCEKQVPLSLQGSLAAVRNSAQAAARIQAAFRVHSFHHREMMKVRELPEIPNEAIIASCLSVQAKKTSHFNDFLHVAAALKIQQKYRGLRGRREFLKIRNRIVKIQAHVRGHLVRKHYKKVVWSVSIVEKAILRWRRKGAGLRGFRAYMPSLSVASDAATTDDYDFLRLGRRQKAAGVEKALARVQSMVRYPEARNQYMRLLASYDRSKLGDADQVQTLEEEPGVVDLLALARD